MGLLQNGYRHLLGGRIMVGATSTDGTNPSVLPGRFHSTPARRNILTGGAITTQLMAVPDGYRHSGAWFFPQKPGALSSVNNTEIAFSPSGAGVLGLPGAGSSALSISVADADGQLIVSASGSTSITFATSAPVLSASLAASGSAAIAFTVTASIGALAGMTGSSTVTFGGSLQSYAVGFLAGSTEDTSVLSTATIAQAVWAALSAENNDAGTMGAKLNAAASGGVDLNALAEAVWDYATRQLSTAPPTASQVADAVWSKTLP